MEKNLDFKVVFYILRKKVMWIIIATVLGAMASYLFSRYMIPERFVSSGQIYISNANDTSILASSDYGDLTAARSLASTYCVILQTARAKQMLGEKLMENEEFMSLPAKHRSSYNISITIEEETEVLKISINSLNPKVSAIVCNTMIHEVSVELINEIFENGKSHPLVGEIKPSRTPVSPNVRANMLIGAAATCAIACILIVLWSLIDNRVKDEQDFVAKVGIPVLGEVPSVNEAAESKGDYYYAYSKK